MTNSSTEMMQANTNCSRSTDIYSVRLSFRDTEILDELAEKESKIVTDLRIKRSWATKQVCKRSSK